MLAAVLGGAIVSGYALALWWLLRREHAWTWTVLVGLCGVSLALRLVYTGAYPWGLFEDEPKFLGCTLQALPRGELFGESCVHVSYLFAALFQAPLVPLIGATRWSIRTYVHITSVLATPAAFAVARQMGLRVAPSLAVGGLVAVLPWSIFFGRTIFGGEVVFHQALFVAGLAGLIWRRDDWRNALLAGFGLCLLLYGYWAGRSMMGLPLLAAVLATGWRRLWCVAVIGIALVGWLPHLATGPLDANVGLTLHGGSGATIASGFNPGFAADPLTTLWTRFLMALSIFVWPIATDGISTLRSAAMHPPVLLGLAAVGLLTGVRRGLFLLAGFVAGLAPGVASSSFGISAHRIMMSYLFVVLAASAALNPVPWGGMRAGAAGLLVATAGIWSIHSYFSEAFWPPQARWEGEMAALAEAVAEAPPARVIFMHQLGYFSVVLPQSAGAEVLTPENWIPANGVATTYVFTWHAEPLRPEYERMLPGRVRPVAQRSFLVAAESADFVWLRRYGWTYTTRCGDIAHDSQVPFVYHVNLQLPSFRCATAAIHEWRGRWSGATTMMQLQFDGVAEVRVGGVTVRSEGDAHLLSFSVPTGDDVSIRLTLPPGATPTALLFEMTPAGRRVPAWDGFTPLSPVGEAG